jgi:hypothetical protein
MLPIVAGAIIGAGAGLLKGLSEREKKKLEAKAQAEIARWSPWTGIQPQTTGLGDKTSDYVLSGATTGAAMGQGVGGGSSGGGGMFAAPSQTTSAGAMMSPNMTADQAKNAAMAEWLKQNGG